MGARAFVISNYDGSVCGDSGTHWNTSTTWTRDASTAREYYIYACSSPGYYFGVSYNYRDSDAGILYAGPTGVAGVYYFSSYLI